MLSFSAQCDFNYVMVETLMRIVDADVCRCLSHDVQTTATTNKRCENYVYNSFIPWITFSLIPNFHNHLKSETEHLLSFGRWA